MTLEGFTWDAYDQNFADNKRSMTNWRRELCPPKYVHKEFVREDDWLYCPQYVPRGYQSLRCPYLQILDHPLSFVCFLIDYQT